MVLVERPQFFPSLGLLKELVFSVSVSVQMFFYRNIWNSPSPLVKLTENRLKRIWRDPSQGRKVKGRERCFKSLKT